MNLGSILIMTTVQQSPAGYSHPQPASLPEKYTNHLKPI